MWWASIPPPGDRSLHVPRRPRPSITDYCRERGNSRLRVLVAVRLRNWRRHTAMGESIAVCREGSGREPLFLGTLISNHRGVHLPRVQGPKDQGTFGLLRPLEDIERGRAVFGLVGRINRGQLRAIRSQAVE